MIIDQNLSSAQIADRKALLRVLVQWFIAFKNIRIYSPQHPSFVGSVEDLRKALAQAFTNRREISVQQTDGLFFIEDFFFIEESLLFYDLLAVLESRSASSVVFMPGAEARELIGLICFLQGMNPDGTEAPKTEVIYSSDRVRLFTATRKGSVDTAAVRGVCVRNAAARYDEWVQRAETAFTALIEDQNCSYADISQPLESLIDAITEDPAIFSVVLAQRRRNGSLAKHAVDSMIMSLYIGIHLNLDMGNLKALGVAALLHDIGRMFLPSDLSTGTPVTAHDAELIQTHCRDGALYLSGVSSLPLVVPRVALEHHLGHDGQGYPALPKSVRPHLFSRIVGLADFLSWATVSDRVYRRPVPMHRLIRSALRRAGSQFPPLLVKIAVSFFGFAPPGTLLRTAQGLEGVAVEPNIRHAARPTIGVAGDAGPRLINLSSPSATPGRTFIDDVASIDGVCDDIEPFAALLNPPEAA